MSTPAPTTDPTNTQTDPGNGNGQGNGNGKGNGNPPPNDDNGNGNPPPNDDSGSDNGSDSGSDNGSDHDHKCPPEPCVPHEFDMTVEIRPVVKLCIAKPDVKIKQNNAVCKCTPCKDKP